MNNKQLQLVTYEQAKKLKAAGFDWPCEYAYHEDGGFCAVGKCDAWNHYGRENSSLPNGYSAPTVALALKWLRDVKGLHGAIARNFNGNWHHMGKGDSDTYESAESALLDEILKLLENEKES